MSINDVNISNLTDLYKYKSGFLIVKIFSKNLLGFSSPEIINSVYHLRYTCYIEELGLSSIFADHENKILTDDLDENGLIFIAFFNGLVVGTLRLNLSRLESTKFDEILNINKSVFFSENTALSTKMFVHKNFRASGVDKFLINTLLEFCCMNDIYHIFLDCRLDLVNYYKRVGFVFCGDSFVHYETGIVQPMMINLLDFKGLEVKNSPLVRNLVYRNWAKREGL